MQSQERALYQIDWKSTFKSKFMFHLQSLFLWKCTTVCWIHQIGAALKFCWSSSKLFILYQSQRSEPGLHSKVKTICRESNKSALASLELTLPATITGAIWINTFCLKVKTFLRSNYIFLVWKAFIIISHSALPQGFCDNKFSAFWRQFHNRKGKLGAAGRSYIIYSCQTLPASSLKAAWSYIQISLHHSRWVTFICAQTTKRINNYRTHVYMGSGLWVLSNASGTIW